MSIASIGQKILAACKYATIAIMVAIWCGFSAFLGFAIGLAINDRADSTHYTGAIIGALVGLVSLIGLSQLNTKKKETSGES
jgi:hypothetical protein